MVKLIVAVIRPHRLDTVRVAAEQAGATGMTAGPVQGVGRQRGHPAVYRGAEYRVDLLPKVRVEVLVELFDAERVAAAIADAARTGEVGDGKVWITDVLRVVRIRTGEVGVEAL